MKKVLFVSALVLLFTSCMTYKSFNETYVVDYSGYLNDGFFITESNSVSFEYLPVGSIETVIKGVKQNNNTNYSVYDAINEFVFRCKDMGANGAINFKVIYTFDKGSGYGDGYGLGYKITGMAIKR